MQNEVIAENETIKNGVSNKLPIEPLKVIAVAYKNTIAADSIIDDDRLIALSFLKFIIKMLLNVR